MADDWIDVPATAIKPAKGDWVDAPAAKPGDDGLPWDVPLTGAQMREQLEKTKAADKTIAAVESTAPDPGLTHLLWSIVGGPLEAAVKGGQSMLSERPSPSVPEALEQAGLGVTPSVGRAIAPAAEHAAESAVTRAAELKAKNESRAPWTPDQVEAAAKSLGAPTTAKAQRVIEKRLNQAGPKTAQEALDKLGEASAAGDPLILPDVFSGAEKLAGRMYRAPGQSSEIIGESLKSRNAGAVGRLTENIDRDVGSGSAYQLFDDLKQARSEAAKPLFDKAKAGGSIAPLETQLQNSFTEASAAEQQAARELQDARNKVTSASGRQTQTGGNVYSTSAANQEAREAEAAAVQAEHNLAIASKHKQDSLDMLRQAQEDRTLGRPGAVWNPRIQEFIEDPDIKAGINRGWQIERNDALAEGRPINATEYAITGFEPDGSPVVGKVPTFRLLQVAKEGLDAMLEGDQYRDKLTGELNKYGVSVAKKLQAYIKELDAANPDYRPARDQWSGDTANMRALKDGQNALKNKPEINQRLAADMSESERESAKLGLAQTLREVALDKGPLAGEFKTIAGTQYGAVGNRARIAPFFNNEADLDRFVKSVDREATKARTANKIMGGSQTAERGAEDASPITARDVANHGISAALGGPRNLLHIAKDLGLKLWDARDPALNAEIARILGQAGASVSRDAKGRFTVQPPGTVPPP